jgi:Flp pilus assembly protein TadD
VSGVVSAARDATFPRIASLFVLAVAVAVTLPTLGAGFVYDDTTIIRDNAALRGWAALARAWASPYWPSQGADVSGLYRPLHVALLGAVWNIGGGTPLAFHIYAIALHAVVVALVWHLLRGGLGIVASVVAVLWFATHPLHVETFASAANSSELLVVAFTIGLTFAIRRSTLREHGASRRDALVVAALSAAAVLSKESGLLALPVAFLTAWGWTARGSDPLKNDVARAETAIKGSDAPRGSSMGHRATGRLWLAGGAALAAALLARTAVLGAPVTRVSIAAPGLDVLGPAQRIEAMMSLWPRIAGMMLWPTALSPYYGPTVLPSHRTTLAVLAGLALLAISAAAITHARRGERRPLVALGWIVLTYLPASNLFRATGQLIADRTLLGATVGVAMALGVLIDRVPWRATVFASVLAALLAARNGAASTRYAQDWSSHRALWQRIVSSSPAEYRGYQLLGIDARERGDSTRALSLLGRAFAMEPRDRRTRFEYGQVLYITGRNAAAADVLAPLLRDGDVRREPSFVAMYLDAVGRSRGAAGVVEAGTPLLRGEAAPTAALYVGTAQEQLGRPAAADSAYVLGLHANPNDERLRARRARLEQGATPR